MTETQVGIGMKPVQRQLLKGLIASARADLEAGPEDAAPRETRVICTFTHWTPSYIVERIIIFAGWRRRGLYSGLSVS